MQKEILSHCLFDETTIELACEPVHLFVIPAGMSGKTTVETNMIYSGQMPDHQRFQIQKFLFSCQHPATCTFLVESRQYGEYKLWGETDFNIIPLMIMPQQNFKWRAISEYAPNKVFITMFGEWIRPVC